MTYRKLYFHHLKKTGGTALNLWLDSQFPDQPEIFEALQQDVQRRYDGITDRAPLQMQIKSDLASGAFHNRDLLHDHAALACHVPNGTFRMTVLRDPVDRLLSQWRDFRRLTPAHIAHYPPPIKAMFADIHRLDLRDFLTIYGRHGAPLGEFFNNYMVRAIADNRIGAAAYHEPDAGQLVGLAQDVLRHDFDCVGDLARDGEISQMVSAAMGWPPMGLIPATNITDKSTLSKQDILAAGPMIAACTRHDATLYALAQSLHQAGLAKVRGYDLATFERQHLRRRLAELPRPSRMTHYDITLPLVASGHGGRRLSRDKHRIIRAVSDQPLVIYMPVTRWSRGQITITFVPNHDAAAQLGPIRVNGVQVTAQIDGATGMLTSEIRTRHRPWVKLHLDPPPMGPDRRQNIAITGYRWTWQGWHSVFAGAA